VSFAKDQATNQSDNTVYIKLNEETPSLYNQKQSAMLIVKSKHAFDDTHLAMKDIKRVEEKFEPFQAALQLITERTLESSAIADDSGLSNRDFKSKAQERHCFSRDTVEYEFKKLQEDRLEVIKDIIDRRRKSVERKNGEYLELHTLKVIKDLSAQMTRREQA